MKTVSCLSKQEIIDLNYFYSYLTNNNQKNNYQSNFKIFLTLIKKTIKHIVKDLICLARNKNIKDKVLLYYNSINQLNALSPINNNLNKTRLIGPYNSGNNCLPMALGYILSFIYLPHFYEIANKNSADRTLLCSNNYFRIEGMYKWWSWYLKYKKPKAIIFSNDHLVWHRVLRKAAQANKIPTIYIQHASVTEKFPKLEFDLSLLEGQDAFEKYSKKEVKGKVELIGMPKFDRYFSYINTDSTIRRIGICTKFLDDIYEIEKLCSTLRASFPDIKMTVRPHPRDPRDQFYQTLINKHNLHFSDSKTENPFDFLKNIDANISGESSIHLESVLMNVYPIYYNMNSEYLDHYGYIKKGLIEDKFKDANDLVSFISKIREKKPNIRHRAKDYVDTVNTPYDGKSTQMAIDIIEKFINTH